MAMDLRCRKIYPATFAIKFEESQCNASQRDVLYCAAELAGADWLKLYKALVELEG